MNNLVGLNRLVPTLLIFGIYPRMTKLDTLSLSLTQHTMAIKKAIDKVRKYTASQQVNDILNTYNGLFIIFLYELPINLPILVYKKGNAG